MKSSSNHANRGKELEEIIDFSNQYYANKKIALIHKVPVEWVVFYDHKTKRVNKAFPKRKSIIDFLGIYKGKSIAFDTKMTNEDKRFPLDNIHSHQLEYLKLFAELGGIAFFLVYFTHHRRVFILMQDLVYKFMSENTRKSIPFEWFVENAIEVNLNKFDYLNHLEV